MFDYKLIEALAAVLEQGSFDKGARALNLTQPAVSQRIKLLEEQTGRVLVVRTSPPVPTEAGRRVLAHFRKVRRLEQDLLPALRPESGPEFSSLPLALNADSLATWFLPAVRSFVQESSVLLDLKVDDQDRTLQLLRDGEVLGCISAQAESVQGCRSHYLGTMDYRLVASPAFVSRWFPDGVHLQACMQAPMVLFNSNDELHHKLLAQAFGKSGEFLFVHHLPSSERFSSFIVDGLACGMLPDQQGRTLLDAGRLVDLLPGVAASVELYWHCWTIRSRLLNRLTTELQTRAGELLGKGNSPGIDPYQCS